MLDLSEYQLRLVESDTDWQAYHRIRRAVLFEARGRYDDYDAAHPDEQRDGNHPFLLRFRGAAVGTVRLDRQPKGWGILRMVAIDEPFQRQGHGRALLALLEGQAKVFGIQCLEVNAAKDAIPFYERADFEMVDPNREAPLMRKNLATIDPSQS